MLVVTPDAFKIVEGLEDQKRDLERLLKDLNPAVTIDIHTYFYLRDALIRTEDAIRSFKTAYFNIFYTEG